MINPCSCITPLLGWHYVSNTEPAGLWHPRCRVCNVILSTQTYNVAACRVYEQGFYDAMEHIRNQKERHGN